MFLVLRSVCRLRDAAASGAGASDQTQVIGPLGIRDRKKVENTPRVTYLGAFLVAMEQTASLVILFLPLTFYFVHLRKGGLYAVGIHSHEGGTTHIRSGIRRHSRRFDRYRASPRIVQAGFRTLILVSVGAALFAATATFAFGEASDAASHVIANIIVGIGFLGTGAVIKAK